MVIVSVMLFLAPLAVVGSVEATASATVVVNSGLSPKALTVQVGTTVTWTLTDGSKHRMRSTSGPSSFDSGGLDPGSTYSFTFNALGTVFYRDEENTNVDAYNGTIDVVATLPAGGGGAGGGTTVPPAPTTTTIALANRAFSPASVSIATGSTVVWNNNDQDPHTVTDRAGTFASGTFGTGASYRRTFTAAGTFQYFCEIHPSMVGVVSVSDPTTGGTLPPPPPPPVVTPPPPIPAPTGANSVRIIDFAFQPATLTVAAGSTVTWSNAGQARHTVAASDGSVISPDIASGASYKRTFDVPGTYLYYCDIHPEMKASIAVTGPGGGAAPGPPVNPPPAPLSGDVQISDFKFSPATITVLVGGSLTFVNSGTARHSATATDGSFDTGLLTRGAISTKIFTTPGTYPYFCTIHAAMTGTVLVTGANGEPPPPAKERAVVAASAGSVQMVDFAFSPTQTTVTAGGSVAFVNAGVAAHTATARDGSFDSGVVQSGGSYRAKFPTPGTFLFYCTIHPQMTGTVRVVGADGAAPPPAAAQGAAGPPLTADVQVFSTSLTPINVRIAQGGAVTWTAMTLSPHIVKADDDSFEGVVTGSKTFRVTFEAPGTYAYRDLLTSQIEGSVTVVADAATIKAGASSDGSKASVKIIDLDFDPREVTVAQHATVTWTNAGQAPHTVTARDGSWTSDLLQQRDQYLHVFDTVGRFEYYCTLHPKMVATIVVTDASGVAPPAAASQGGANTPPAPGSLGHSAKSGFDPKPLIAVLLTIALLWFGASVLRGAGAQITGKPLSKRTRGA